jgi:hypothetical protein
VRGYLGRLEIYPVECVARSPHPARANSETLPCPACVLTMLVDDPQQDGLMAVCFAHLRSHFLRPHHDVAPSSRRCFATAPLGCFRMSGRVSSLLGAQMWLLLVIALDATSSRRSSPGRRLLVHTSLLLWPRLFTLISFFFFIYSLCLR